MNSTKNAIDASFSVSWIHKLRFTSKAFQENGVLDSLVLELNPQKLLVFVDSGLASENQTFQQALHHWCSRTDAVCSTPLIVSGGEDAKNDETVLEQILVAINNNNLCRKSCLLVIGGGAVLDVVGYAASIAHRGIPLIRMPSTTLSQGDSGVGVKNGVNYFGKKNFKGVFTPPFAVINDSSLLKSLDDKHWRSGLSEAIKVALIKDEELFVQIESSVSSLLDRDSSDMSSVLRKSAELHLNHITEGGDPFEQHDARPLDFGHWAAHKLEQLTNFELSHGNAVSIGLSIDVLCSAELGHLDRTTANRVISLLQSFGLPTNHPELSNPLLLDGIEEFRQHLGGTLTLLMLGGIAKPIYIHELDPKVVRQVFDKLM